MHKGESIGPVGLQPGTKNIGFFSFYFVGKQLHSKFQKFSSNSFDFAHFLHFWSILAVFWPKEAKNCQN
jgi:hypothetical protein